MSHLINRKAVKEYALEVAKQRSHSFTRVGGDFLLAINERVKQDIENIVKNLPSVGKTISVK